MGRWTRKPYQSSGNDVAESQAHSPSGGSLAMWLVGVGVALLPIYYGIRCLLTGRAIFFGRRGAHIELTGSAAVALAIAYIAVGVLIHAHWFWALHPKLAWYGPLLKVLALLVFIGAFAYTCYSIMAA